MQVGAAVASGLAGACVLTAIHETARHTIPHAPHVNALGERALARAAQALGGRTPTKSQLYAGSLAGEVVSNSLYYALAGLAGPERSLQAGALLGLAGGIGAVVLPEPLGLGQQPYRRTPITEILTVAWYMLGGIAAGATYERMAAGFW